MNRKEARLLNLKRLVAEYGSIVAVANASGTSEKYLGELINRTPSKSGKPRQMGDLTAEKIEVGCGKGRGWMDIDHNATQPIGGPALNSTEAELLRLYRESTPNKRRALLAVARLKIAPD